MAKRKTEKVKVSPEDIERELEEIRQSNPEGKLHARAVVEFARNPRTALHHRFEWDDTEAAEKFRLMQARQVIRVFVKDYPREHKTIRAYVSLVQDRKKGGGYRSSEEVLRETALRDALVYQAHRAMKAFISKYEDLEELAGVIAAMEGAMIPDEAEA